MDDKSPEEVADAIRFLCDKFSDDNYSGILVYYEPNNQTTIHKVE